MSLQVFSNDDLRVLFRKLEKENQYLKALLDKASIPYKPNDFFDSNPTEAMEYDADQSNRINTYELT
jgi:hypothetical protein